MWFALWMPDGGAVLDRNPGERPFSVPRGGPNSTAANQSALVHARLRYLEDGWDGVNSRPYLSPSDRDRNYVSLMKRLYPDRILVSKERGLTRVTRVPEGHYYFWKDSSIEFQLDCGIDESEASICSGDIYERARGRVISVRLQKQLLVDIKKIVETIDGLIQAWSR